MHCVIIYYGYTLERISKACSCAEHRSDVVFVIKNDNDANESDVGVHIRLEKLTMRFEPIVAQNRELCYDHKNENRQLELD